MTGASLGLVFIVSGTSKILQNLSCYLAYVYHTVLSYYRTIHIGFQSV